MPAVGYQFTEWSDGSKEAKRTILPTQDMDLYAKFEIKPLSLPVFEINTEDKKPIEDKETYIRCTASLSNTENPFEFQGETGKIKGRGNTTWTMPKKPYKLKFDEKVDLFGFGAAKTWVLLADFGDKSLLRNRIAQGMGETLGLEFNNKTMPVEVYLNGQYDGEYLICKQTEAGKTRVNIDEEPNTTDPAFLLELDSRAVSEGVENVDWFSLDGHIYGIKSPETDEEGYPAEATLAIKEKLGEFWSALWSGNYAKVRAQIDVESFAKTYIVNELTHPVDIGWSSWYVYRDKGGKLKSGPLWDYDVSMGNISYHDGAKNPRELYAVQNIWYQKLLEYPEFKEMVGRLLTEYQEKIETTISEIVEEAKQKKDSYQRNFERWEILGHLNWPNPPEIAALKTWEEQVDFVVNYLKESYAFLLETYP